MTSKFDALFENIMNEMAGGGGGGGGAAGGGGASGGGMGGMSSGGGHGGSMGAGMTSLGGGHGHGGMSSGPIEKASVIRPESPFATYVLFNGGKKKHFKTEIEKRDFLKDNPDWKETSDI